MKPAFTRSVREEILSLLWIIASILSYPHEDLAIASLFFAIIGFVSLILSVVYKIKDG